MRFLEEPGGGTWRRNLEDWPDAGKILLLKFLLPIPAGDKACVKYELHKLEIEINRLDLKYVFPQSRWGKP